MKIKVVISSLLSFILLSPAFAQEVEHDDMYFNKKDRAKLITIRESENALARNTKSVTRKYEEVSDEEDVNPTDSYSARNVNPEYTSRQQSRTAKIDDEDYFVNNYEYNNLRRYNNWNNNFNNWYNNPWYNSAYWSQSINSWNSPYYGSYYDMWDSPWANPYYRSGWSSSFSYYWGNSWNYGWGMNNGWGNPYNSWNSWGNNWGPSYYWNQPYYNVVVVNNGNEAGRKRVYGKAPSRGTGAVYNPSESRSRFDDNGTGRNNSNGRVSKNQEVYYNRNWRNSGAEQQQSAPLDSRNETQYNRSRNWGGDNNDNSSWGRSSTNSTSTPSYNSSGGTRTNTSPAGSGSNGRSRGRD